MPTRTLSSLLTLLLLVFLSPPVAADSLNASCPLDLSYVPTFPWESAQCSSPVANLSLCCQQLLGLFGIGLAERLRFTHLFRLPNASASAACLSAFSSPPLSLPTSLVPTCFPSTSYFAISANFCAGIQTANEFVATLGTGTMATLDAACQPELVQSRCYGCFSAGLDASSRLTGIDGNNSHALSCFYLTVLYAAGISNSNGPTATATCVRTVSWFGYSAPDER